MTTGTLTHIARRELACRVTGGLEVILHWSALDNGNRYLPSFNAGDNQLPRPPRSERTGR
jgi:hypothetical protein